MNYKTLRLRRQGRLATVRLSRAPSRNGFGAALADELSSVCQTINEDDSIHAVILAGERGAFCLDLDATIAQAADAGPGPAETRPMPASIACQAVASLDCPVIAAIDGDAVGAGLELAMCCDIRIASATARFSLPQVQDGLLPSGGATQRLPRLVGKGKAIELLLLGITIDAQEAHRLGLVNEVTAPARLNARAREMARAVVSRGPIAVRYAKEAVNKGMDLTLGQGLRLEADLNIILQTTLDRAEGVSAFMEKRKSNFEGV